MNKEDHNFMNLTYQEFWEDKILLIEFNLIPNEIIKDILEEKYVTQKKIIINNNQYFFQLSNLYSFNNLYSLYIIEIKFSIEPHTDFLNSNSLECSDFLSLNNLANNNCWSLGYIMRSESKPKMIQAIIPRMMITPCMVYTHKVLLTWEEITDKSYLDFIIKSASECLKEHIKKTLIKYLHEYEVYFNKSNIIKISIIPNRI